jgi:hypothetical protein
MDTPPADNATPSPSAPMPTASQSAGGSALGKLFSFTIEWVLDNCPDALKIRIALILGAFLGAVLRPIIRQEVMDAFALFRDTSEVAKPNADLEKEWDNPTHIP